MYRLEIEYYCFAGLYREIMHNCTTPPVATRDLFNSLVDFTIRYDVFQIFTFMTVYT